MTHERRAWSMSGHDWRLSRSGAGINLGRRRFMVQASSYAGGMAIVLTAPSMATAAEINKKPWGEPSLETETEFSPWLAISPDDTVTVRVTMPEVGNGMLTQIPMTVTEELECDWSKVRAEYAPVHRDYAEDRCYSANNTEFPYFSGHSTDPARMKLALQVGASARERLKAAAAARWDVPVAEVSVKNGTLIHESSGRSLRYGEVAAEAAGIQLEQEPDLKPQSAWTFLGKAAPSKIHSPKVVSGSAVFGMDVRLPGMVYAALMQSPVQGGKLRKFDASVAMKMPGVRTVVTIDPCQSRGSPIKTQTPYRLSESVAQSAIAVIADHYWQARKALEAVHVEWDDGEGVTWKSHEQIYDAAIATLDKGGGTVERSMGDTSELAAGLADVEGLYVTPYCEQTSIEPLNGTALVTDDSVELWHPCQDPQQAMWVAADETGVSPEKIRVNPTFVGGAFGRRVYGNDVRMVVAVARRYPGVPVHVIWSREETMRQGRYRAAITARFRARLGANKLPDALHGQVVRRGLAPSINLSDSPYSVALIPNLTIEVHDKPTHILTGPYRGPGYNSYAFIYETFIDECAVAAGIDPLEYRLRLFKAWPDPSWSDCLTVAAAKAEWGKPLPKGMGRGIAISNWTGFGKPFSGSTVCAVATVEVSPDGILDVKSLDLSFDCGRIVNRDAVAAQLEGGAIYGLNMSLNEEITIADSRVVEGNFDQYPMVRLADVPEIRVHFDALSGHDRFSMMGEAPAGPIGPAIGNAIFQATGHRLRSTPFREHDLRWL